MLKAEPNKNYFKYKTNTETNMTTQLDLSLDSNNAKTTVM